MAQVFTFFVDQIGAWMTWLTSWQLYGIPFLYYFMGFVIMGIIMDYVFG